jgi:hypothetical protein
VALGHAVSLSESIRGVVTLGPTQRGGRRKLHIELLCSIRHPGPLLTAELSALGEAEIEALSIWQNVMTYFEQLERHLLDEILVFANLAKSLR